MTKEEIKTQVSRAAYFRDSEGRLRIVEVLVDSFKARDLEGEIYELFYCDYALDRQKFEIIK